MMRLLIAVLVSTAVSAGGAWAGSADSTRLTVALYPNGRGTVPVRRYSLRCDPARGTVADPVRACRALARLKYPFAPVAPGTICSQVALGPQEAFVSGTLRGQRVNAHLSLRDGCEIARWQRLRSVVPGFAT